MVTPGHDLHSNVDDLQGKETAHIASIQHWTVATGKVILDKHILFRLGQLGTVVHVVSFIWYVQLHAY